MTITPGTKTGGDNGGGRFTIAITPNADNQILRALREGDTHVETFTMLVRYRSVTADDVEYWSQSTETFTVLFRGQNEAPEVVPTNVVREAAELAPPGPEPAVSGISAILIRASRFRRQACWPPTGRGQHPRPCPCGRWFRPGQC